MLRAVLSLFMQQIFINILLCVKNYFKNRLYKAGSGKRMSFRSSCSQSAGEAGQVNRAIKLCGKVANGKVYRCKIREWPFFTWS